MRNYLRFNVNGKNLKVENPDPELTLASYLRNSLGLTGTKVACGEGSCGSCAVVVGRWNDGSAKYCAINACVTPLFFVDGCLIITVEGVGNKKKLHAVQERLAKGHGTQCGFCSPGFVISAYALLRNNPNPSKYQIRQAIKGNLCRCTGYRPILEAFYSFADGGCCQGKENVCPCKEAGVGEKDLTKLVTWSDFPKLDPSQDLIFPPSLMRKEEISSFEFRGRFITILVPHNEEELLMILRNNSGVQIVSIGMITSLRKRNTVTELETWVGIWNVAEYRHVEEQQDYVSFGSALSISELVSLIEAKCDSSISSAFTELADKFSSSKIINQSSWAGSIATKSATDVGTLLRVLNSKLVIISTDGEKTIEMRDLLSSGLPKGSVIKAVHICKQTDGFVFFWKGGVKGSADQTVLNCSAHISQEKVDIFFGLKGVYIASIVVRNCILNSKHSFEELTEAVESDFTPVKTHPDHDFALGLAKAALFHLSLRLQGKDSPQTDKSDLGFTQIYRATSEHAIRRPLAHEYSDLSTSGEAVFVGDQKLKGSAYLGFVLSTASHAKFSIDTYHASQEPGVLGVYDFKSITGNNLPGMLSYNTYPDNTPVLADGEVESKGQPIAVVATESPEQAIRAAKLVKVTYEPLPAVLSLQEAIEKDSVLAPPNIFGVPEKEIQTALSNGTKILEGEAFIAGQEHMYMEPQSAWATPQENDHMVVYSSTQAQCHVQNQTAAVLGVPSNKVVIKTKRLGGGFGGKSNQSVFTAAVAAIVARDLERPVAALLSREEDCLITGKRHPTLFKYKVAVDDEGRIEAAHVKAYLDGGYSTEHSIGVAFVAGAMFNICYNIPIIRVETQAMKTNKTSNTAFRGYGNPQVAYAWETIVQKVAKTVGKRPEEIRELNFSHDGDKFFGGVIQTQALKSCWDEVKQFSDVQNKLKEIEEFNRKNSHIKRGLSMSGTRFPQTHDTIHEQAAALVQIYLDGSIAVSIGGVEMGQGLFTKCRQVAAKAFGLPIEKIIILESSTDKTANSPETGGSQGADIHGKAIMLCIGRLMEKIRPLMKEEKSWEEVVWEAHNLRLPLQATEHMIIDRAAHNIASGQPTYFTTGAACVVAEVDCISGEHKVGQLLGYKSFQLLSVDIVMDVGESLNPAADVGQIEGGFFQGYGLLTCEEVNWDKDGALKTTNFSSYSIPTSELVPSTFRVKLIGDTPGCSFQVYSSKGIGEPPYMLGTAAYGAILDAVYAKRAEVGKKGWLQVDSPLSRKRVLELCN